MDMIQLQVCVVQESDINAVLTDELVRFQFPVADPGSFPMNQPQGFSPFVLLGCTAIFGFEEYDGFQYSSLRSFPCWEGGTLSEDGESTLQVPEGRFSRLATPSRGDSFGGVDSVESACLVTWLVCHHRYLTYCGLALADRGAACCSVRLTRSEEVCVMCGSSLSLYLAAPLVNVVPPQAQTLPFKTEPRWNRFCFVNVFTSVS